MATSLTVADADRKAADAAASAYPGRLDSSARRGACFPAKADRVVSATAESLPVCSSASEAA